MELAPHRPPAHAAATTNDERNSSMDELERRVRALEMRQHMLEMLEARRIARSFTDEAQLRLWGERTTEDVRAITEGDNADPDDITGPLYLAAWSGLFAKALQHFQQEN